MNMGGSIIVGINHNPQTVFIQNIGKGNASNVEVHFAFKPDFYQIWPAFKWENSINPDGFLHKPVSPETLRKQVLQVLSRDAHFVEIHRPERPWFGPLTPFAKKHLLESHPHTLHHRARRLAS